MPSWVLLITGKGFRNVNWVPHVDKVATLSKLKCFLFLSVSYFKLERVELVSIMIICQNWKIDTNMHHLRKPYKVMPSSDDLTPS